MSAALYESVARIARHHAGIRLLPAVGRVTETFGAGGAIPDHAATVELRDSGVLLPRVPIAVGMLGFAALPAADDLVLVVFLDGDPNAPVIVARLYTNKLAPPTDGKDGKIALALPAGKTDTKLKLTVAADGSTATLELGSEPVKLVLDDQQVSVTIGEVELTVTKSGGGRVELKAGSTEITLKKDGDLAVKTSKKLTLEGNEVEISGQSKVKISGGSVEIN